MARLAALAAALAALAACAQGANLMCMLRDGCGVADGDVLYAVPSAAYPSQCDQVALVCRNAPACDAVGTNGTHCVAFSSAKTVDCTSGARARFSLRTNGWSGKVAWDGAVAADTTLDCPQTAGLLAYAAPEWGALCESCAAVCVGCVTTTSLE